MMPNPKPQPEGADFFVELFSQIRDILAVLDERMVIRYINEAVQDHLGWRPEEMMGRAASEFLHPEDLSEIAHRFARISAGSQKRKPVVIRLLSASGTYQFWEVLGRDARTMPNVNGFVIVARSVQDRQNFEYELRLSEQRQRAFLAAFPDWIGRVSPDGYILDLQLPANLPKVYDLESFKGQYISSILPESQRSIFNRMLREVAQHNQLVTAEIELPFGAMNGPRLLELRATPSGQNEILILARDVTDERANRQQIQQQSDLLGSLHELSLDVLEHLELDRVQQNIVQRACELVDTDHGIFCLVNENDEARITIGTGPFSVDVGHTLRRGQGATGLAWQRAEIVVVNDYPEWAGQHNPGPGTPPQAVIGVPLLSGRRVSGLFTLGRMEADKPFSAVEVELLRRFAQLAAIALDNARLYQAATAEIQVRQAAEVELRRRDTLLQAVRYTAEAFLSSQSWQSCLPDVLERLALAASVDCAFVVQHLPENSNNLCYQQQAIWVHPDFAYATAKPELDTTTFINWQESFRNRQMVSIITEKLPPAQQAQLQKQGIQSLLLAPIFVNLAWWGVIGFGVFRTARTWETAVEDALQAAADTLGVAMRRQMSDALMQRTQKLESLGLLAGGIAHDFNNLLTGVLGQTSLVSAKLGGDHPASKNVEKAIQSTRIAASLVRQMLAYAGKEEFVIEPLDLNQLIQNNGGLLETIVPRSGELTFDLEPDLPLIEGDKGQIQQVVMNLAINAAQALPEGKGKINICTRTVSWSGQQNLHPFNQWSDLATGRYVCLLVRDTGVGMDGVTRGQVFDPFFSTKTNGHGLGLSATQGIIQNHQGRIWIDSEPGQGTGFWIVLPASTITAVEEPVTPLPTPTASGAILVIDDEYHVREAAADILGLAGLEVITAQDGVAGLRYFQRHHDEVALVLLDLTMPKMDGEETFQRLRRLNPDVKVVLSTGFGDLSAKERLVHGGVNGFLQKPYDAQALLECIQAVLENRRPPSTIGSA
ncbi:MAG: response regulator [Anaerolineales bacterium]|nr:response regulator [Anaerolineales bacterium]